MNCIKDNDEIDLTWPHVSVLIVNFNGKRWLEKFLDSVLNSDYPKERKEVILIDNGSKDGSVEFVSNKFGSNPRLKMIPNKENLGWAKAINKGMKMATGEIIACISNDVEVDREWLKEIIKVMNSNPKVGMIQCNSISVWDRKTPDSAMNYLDKFGFAYGYESNGKPMAVTFAEGLAWATRRCVIDEIGMLDENYFMEFDDQDFSWRTILAGYQVFFVPTAIVYHVRGGTQGRTFFQRLRNSTWYTTNHIATLMKNHSVMTLLQTVPFVVTVDVGKAIYLSIKKKPAFSFAILKGFFFVLKDLKPILQKRWIIQHKVRRVSDKEVLKFMVPFNLKLLLSFLTSQSKGQRFILKLQPPITK